MKRFAWLALYGLVCAGCGGSNTSPSQPAQVAGTWHGTVTLTSFTGGECLASVFQSAVGASGSFTATLTQSGTSVTASVANDSTGGACTYTGSINGNALVLNTTGCQQGDVLGARCPGGALRDILLQSETINATVNGNSLSGTAAETDNIVISGTTILVGTFAGTSAVTAVRQ